ncbi:TPA: hypothetical protein QDB28_004038 [Burkholderia vietnamiensis]|nr:hypothetical protein [Burkholderia vietnamiensis]
MTAIYMAALDCPHIIENGTITLHFDPNQPGHNALNQLSRRLTAVFAAHMTAEGKAPEGCLIVPIEPTKAGLDRGEHVASEHLNDNAPIGQARYRAPAQAIYQAMIEEMGVKA